MASIDKAAIGWSIAIVAVGVAIAFAGQSGQDLGVGVQAPQMTERPSTTAETPAAEPETQTDPFADLASKVKEESSMIAEDESVMAEEESVMAEEESVMAEEESVMAEEEPTGPQTVKVDMPAGTAVPGCEETNECYVPASVTINVGDTVEWYNSDTAAHTVTSGSPANGPSGVFDSSLVMGSASYSFTFEEAGSYDYFCMVHPWMIGDVQVN